MWSLVQTLYGGSRGHSIDLMARSSNVQSDFAGYPLPFFSESPMANALGVSVFAQSSDLYGPEVFANPYVFPPVLSPLTPILQRGLVSVVFPILPALVCY